MNKLHEVLINQLTRLNIDWRSESLAPHWQDLLKIISDTYLENDEYRYAMERSLDIASDEINQANDIYQTELNKINMVSSDGIIMTDLDWNITSVNNRAEILLKSSETELLGRSIVENLIFLNAQKEPLFFEKLTLHFECGKSYKCTRGIIVNALSQEHEFFALYSITPFYVQDKMNAYIIIFRDITQEVLKDFDYLLDTLINATAMENKREQVVSWCQAMFSDLHDALLISELNQQTNNHALTLLEKNVIHQGMLRQSGILNQMFLHCAKNEENHEFFDLEKIIPTIKDACQKLSAKEDVVIHNKVSDVIEGESSQFMQLNFEIVAKLMEAFKSCKLDALEFNTLSLPMKNDKKLIVSYQLKLVRPMDLKKVNALLLGVKEKLTDNRVEALTCKYLDTSLEIEAILKFFIPPPKVNKATHTISLLRCLIYSEETSTLIEQMNDKFLLSQIYYEEVKAQDDVVKKIKEARLSNNEYNVIICDKHDFEAFDKNVLHEISSYINEHFCGVIYINQNEQAIHSEINLKIYALNSEFFLKEINGLLYEMHEKNLYSQQNKLLVNRDIKVCSGKKIIFLDLEIHANTLYLRLLEGLGFQVCLLKSLDEIDLYAHMDFDALMFNIYDDFHYVAHILQKCQKNWPEMPAVMLSPPIIEDTLTALLQQGIAHYLFKPFTLPDFIYLVQRCFDSK